MSTGIAALPSHSFVSRLKAYKVVIERQLKEALQEMKTSSELHEACSYALLGGGKRFRPLLAMMVARALDPQASVDAAALGVEFFHTASLIADDLPCMDDEEERRERPAVHKIFGEATALLASYALIAAGYEWVQRNGKVFTHQFPGGGGEKRTLLAMENVSQNTGLNGASLGQYLDLFGPGGKEELTREVVRLKTGALFEISFVLGWLFGGGELDALPQVKRAAHHFGMAFQIADDFQDQEEDFACERQFNFVALLGELGARNAFFQEVAAYEALLKSFEGDFTDLLDLSTFLLKPLVEKKPS